jgi:hypothetical protein
LELEVLGGVAVVIQQEIRVVEDVGEHAGIGVVGIAVGAAGGRADVNSGGLAGEEP